MEKYSGISVGQKQRGHQNFSVAEQRSTASQLTVFDKPTQSLPQLSFNNLSCRPDINLGDVEWNIELKAQQRRHLHIFHCQRRSRGVCWTRSLCRWKWISFYPFCRLRRRISCGADSCAARPAQKTLLSDMTGLWCQDNLVCLRKIKCSDYLGLGIQDFDSVDGDLQLHFGGLLSLGFLDMSLELEERKAIDVLRLRLKMRTRLWKKKTKKHPIPFQTLTNPIQSLGIF